MRGEGEHYENSEHRKDQHVVPGTQQQQHHSNWLYGRDADASVDMLQYQSRLYG